MDLDKKIKVTKKEDGREVVEVDKELFSAIQSHIEDADLLEAILENETKNEPTFNQVDAMEYYNQLEKSE